VTKLERKALAANLFDIPQGYKIIDLQQMFTALGAMGAMGGAMMGGTMVGGTMMGKLPPGLPPGMIPPGMAPPKSATPRGAPSVSKRP
jgi:hypothetical protein